MGDLGPMAEQPMVLPESMCEVRAHLDPGVVGSTGQRLQKPTGCGVNQARGPA